MTKALFLVWGGGIDDQSFVFGGGGYKRQMGRFSFGGGVDDQSFVFGGGGGITGRWAGFLFWGGGGEVHGGGAIWAAGHKSIRGVSKSVYILAWIASHNVSANIFNFMHFNMIKVIIPPAIIIK